MKPCGKGSSFPLCTTKVARCVSLVPRSSGSRPRRRHRARGPGFFRNKGIRPEFKQKIVLPFRCNDAAEPVAGLQQRESKLLLTFPAQFFESVGRSQTGNTATDDDDMGGGDFAISSCRTPDQVQGRL